MAHLLRSVHDACVHGVLAERRDTLWLVDLLRYICDIFIRAIFQSQRCSRSTLWLGARCDVCLNGRGLKPVSEHPRHRDRETEQGSGSISWMCKLPREASCRLRPFWQAFRCNFWMISSTPSLDPEFGLEGRMPNQMSWLCKLPREASYHL